MKLYIIDSGDNLDLSLMMENKKLPTLIWFCVKALFYKENILTFSVRKNVLKTFLKEGKDED